MSTDGIWYTRCPVPTAFGVAVRTGALEDELAPDGIAIRSLAASPDRTLRQAHFDQSAPRLLRHGGEVPVLTAAAAGAPVRIIGLSWENASEVILALPGSGIDQVSDLRGRRVSLPRRVNDPIDFWKPLVVRGVHDALALAGLTLDDVTLVDVPTTRAFVDGATTDTDPRTTLWDGAFMLGHQREEAAALVRGEVDAVYSGGAMAAILQGFTGARTVVDLAHPHHGAGRDGGATPLVLTTTADLLDERPDVVSRILARVRDAAAWTADHPSDTRRIIAADCGLPEDLVAAAFTPDIHARLGVDLANDKVARLREQAAFLHAHGYLEREVDVDALIVAEAVA